jgi:hypothetical protein
MKTSYGANHFSLPRLFELDYCSYSGGSLAPDDEQAAVAQ